MIPPESRSDLRAALTPAVESRYRIERELDGNTVAFLAESHDGTRRLMVRAADDIAAKALPGTEGAGQAFFSSDG